MIPFFCLCPSTISSPWSFKAEPRLHPSSAQNIIMVPISLRTKPKVLQYPTGPSKVWSLFPSIPTTYSSLLSHLLQPHWTFYGSLITAALFRFREFAPAIHSTWNVLSQDITKAASLPYSSAFSVVFFHSEALWGRLDYNLPCLTISLLQS